VRRLILLLSLLVAHIAGARELGIDVGGRPYFFAAADFNGDGRMDLAVSGARFFGDAIPPDGYFLSLFESAGGTFQVRATTTSSFLIGPLSAADVDGDGRPDLVTPQNVWFAPAASGFADSRWLPVPNGTYAPYAVTTGDFNGDGRVDIAVANLEGRSVAVFTYTSEIAIVGSFPVDHDPYAIRAADFDSDGIADIATAGADGSISILYGDREFRMRMEHSSQAGKSFRDIATADFNGDAKADIVALDILRESAFVFLRSAVTMDQAFELPASSFVLSVAAGDVTGDGVPEILIGQLDGVITVFGFEPRAGFTPRLFLPRGGDAFQLAVLDVDGDSFGDLVIADPTSTRLTVLFGPMSRSSFPRRRAVRR
jgi:VCBS repeat protein/FG-GAP repeat protein